jgi:hypothetical protein
VKSRHRGERQSDGQRQSRLDATLTAIHSGNVPAASSDALNASNMVHRMLTRRTALPIGGVAAGGAVAAYWATR